MNKIFFIILYLLIAFSAHAGNAVLLTSLDAKKITLKRIEKKFKKTYSSSGLKLVIYHKASPEILYKTLTDEDTEVLIWISHAAGEHPSENGMEAKGLILDYYGNNVKNFFTLIPPRLRFLGIVGCSARSIIDGFKERGNYINRPNLEIKSFNKKVKLYTGLNQTLKASKKHIKKELLPINEDPEVKEISITGQDNLPKSWLEMGDKIIAFIDSNETNYLGRVSQPHWDSLQNKNIKYLRDLSEKSSSLPFLKIETTGNYWERFALPDGRVLGSKDQHLYLIK